MEYRRHSLRKMKSVDNTTQRYTLFLIKGYKIYFHLLSFNLTIIM